MHTGGCDLIKKQTSACGGGGGGGFWHERDAPRGRLGWEWCAGALPLALLGADFHSMLARTWREFRASLGFIHVQGALAPAMGPKGGVCDGGVNSGAGVLCGGPKATSPTTVQCLSPSACLACVDTLPSERSTSPQTSRDGALRHPTSVPPDHASHEGGMRRIGPKGRRGGEARRGRGAARGPCLMTSDRVRRAVLIAWERAVHDIRQTKWPRGLQQTEWAEGAGGASPAHPPPPAPPGPRTPRIRAHIVAPQNTPQISRQVCSRVHVSRLVGCPAAARERRGRSVEAGKWRLVDGGLSATECNGQNGSTGCNGSNGHRLGCHVPLAPFVAPPPAFLSLTRRDPPPKKKEAIPTSRGGLAIQRGGRRRAGRRRLRDGLPDALPRRVRGVRPPAAGPGGGLGAEVRDRDAARETRGAGAVGDGEPGRRLRGGRGRASNARRGSGDPKSDGSGRGRSHGVEALGGERGVLRGIPRRAEVGLVGREGRRGLVRGWLRRGLGLLLQDLQPLLAQEEDRAGDAVRGLGDHRGHPLRRVVVLEPQALQHPHGGGVLALRARHRAKDGAGAPRDTHGLGVGVAAERERGG